MADRLSIMNWPGHTVDERRRARDAAVIAERLNALTIAEISRKLDVSEASVKSILQRNGISRPKRVDNKHEKIIELYRKHENGAAVARIMNMSPSTIQGVIQKWRDENGIAAPERQKAAERVEYTRDVSGNVPVTLPYLRFLDPARRLPWERGHA